MCQVLLETGLDWQRTLPSINDDWWYFGIHNHHSILPVDCSVAKSKWNASIGRQTTIEWILKWKQKWEIQRNRLSSFFSHLLLCCWKCRRFCWTHVQTAWIANAIDLNNLLQNRFPIYCALLQKHDLFSSKNFVDFPHSWSELLYRPRNTRYCTLVHLKLETRTFLFQFLPPRTPQFFQAINAYCAQFHSRNVKSEFNNRHDIKRRCGKRLQRNAKLQWNTLMRYIKWVVFHKSINKFVVETKLIRKCTWIVLARKLRFYEWSRLHLEA